MYINPRSESTCRVNRFMHVTLRGSEDVPIILDLNSAAR
jgi:hypothetical protein